MVPRLWAGGQKLTVWGWVAAMSRRWPVIAAGLICTACAIVAVHERPVSYQACGSVVVSSPVTSTNPNVYNNIQGSLIATAGWITVELQSSPVQRRLAAQGASAVYEAQVHNTGTTETPAYSEPEMDVCASSLRPDLALRTANAVLAEFGVLLRSKESSAHVPARALVLEQVLASPGADAETGRPSQAYLGVACIGLIMTSACALWIDRYLRRRPKFGLLGNPYAPVTRPVRA